MRRIGFLCSLFLIFFIETADASFLFQVPAKFNQPGDLLIWPDRAEDPGSEEFREGVIDFKNGSYREALNQFITLTEKYPETETAILALLYKGITYHRMALRDKDNESLFKALQTFQEYVRKYPETSYTPLTLIQIGLIYLDMNLLIEARGTFDRVLKEFPDKKRYVAMAQYYIGLSYEKEGKYKDALYKYKMHYLDYPEEMERERIFSMARVLSKLHECGKADKFYKEGIRRWPAHLKGNPGILFYYSECQFQNGSLPEAMDGFYAFYNIYPEDGKAGFALTRIGDIYMLEKRYDAATRIYKNVLDFFPNSEAELISKLRIGDIKFLTSKDPLYREAWKYFKEVESSDNFELSLMGRYRIGKVLEARGHLPESVSLYMNIYKKAHDDLKEEALSSFKRAFKKLTARVRSDIKGGKYLEVVKAYQGVLKDYTSYIRDGSLLLDIGDIHERLFLYEDASEIYKDVIKRDRKNRKAALFKLGRLYSHTGDYDNSIDTLNRYISLKPKREGYISALITLGESYLKSGDKDRAANHFYEVIRKAPYKYPDIYFSLSSILFDKGLMDDGITLLNDFVRHYPGGNDSYLMRAYISLGNTYYDKGNYREAMDNYTMGMRYVSNTGEKDTLKFMIGDCLFKINRIEEAKKIFLSLRESTSELVKQASAERLEDLDIDFTL